MAKNVRYVTASKHPQNLPNERCHNEQIVTGVRMVTRGSNGTRYWLSLYLGTDTFGTGYW